MNSIPQQGSGDSPIEDSIHRMDESGEKTYLGFVDGFSRIILRFREELKEKYPDIEFVFTISKSLGVQAYNNQSDSNGDQTKIHDIHLAPIPTLKFTLEIDISCDEDFMIFNPRDPEMFWQKVWGQVYSDFIVFMKTHKNEWYNRNYCNGIQFDGYTFLLNTETTVSHESKRLSKYSKSSILGSLTFTTNVRPIAFS